MKDNKVACEIFFTESGSTEVKRIIGQVDEIQFYSSFNVFIVVENYEDKTIGKDEIVAITPYKIDKDNIVSIPRIEINTSLKIES